MLRILLGRRITDSFSSVDAIARSLVDVTSTEIDGLIARLEAESAKGPDHHDEGVSQPSVDSVLHTLTKARAARGSGDERGYQEAITLVAYLMGENWRLDAPLPNDIMRLCNATRNPWRPEHMIWAPRASLVTSLRPRKRLDYDETLRALEADLRHPLSERLSAADDASLEGVMSALQKARGLDIVADLTESLAALGAARRMVRKWSFQFQPTIDILHQYQAVRRVGMDGLIQRLTNAIAEYDSARESDAALATMHSVRRALTRARMARDAGDEPAYLENLEVAAYQISDSWPYDSALGSDILGYIQGLRRR